MTSYRFTSAALAELRKATLYYEELENGLGAIFLDEIDAAIERILANPHADLYGFRTDENGKPVFDFTAEERQEINDYFRAFEGTAVLKGYEEQVRNLTTARAV